MEIVTELLPYVKLIIITVIAIPVIALIFFIIAWFKMSKDMNK